MKLSLREFFVGLIVLGIVASVLILARNKTYMSEILVAPKPTPPTQAKVEGMFNVKIPDDVEKTDLNDVSNEGKVYSGIATRKFENNVFQLTILSDLPDVAGRRYSAVLSKTEGDTSGKIILGNLEAVKGGYILNYSSSQDLSDYKRVTVVRDGKDLLMGEFK
jgi:hypothetical protein